ncbi:MAG: hypothetical protein WCH13_18410 [Deltaproteobacteria bacterium]
MAGRGCRLGVGRLGTGGRLRPRILAGWRRLLPIAIIECMTPARRRAQRVILSHPHRYRRYPAATMAITFAILDCGACMPTGGPRA